MRHLTRVLKFTVFISPIKPVTRHESILFIFDLPVIVAGVLASSFQFELHFCSEILANFTANWKTHGPTKPDNRIINTINHHINWVILYSYLYSYKKTTTISKNQLSFYSTQVIHLLEYHITVQFMFDYDLFNLLQLNEL